MKNIRGFLSENFHFLVIKFSVYLNRHVFVMNTMSSFLKESKENDPMLTSADFGLWQTKG